MSNSKIVHLYMIHVLYDIFFLHNFIFYETNSVFKAFVNIINNNVLNNAWYLEVRSAEENISLTYIFDLIF